MSLATTSATSPVISPDQDAEVLGMMLGAKGTGAVGDLLASITNATNTAAHMATGLADQNRENRPFQQPFHRFVLHVAGQVDRAQNLRSRVVSLAKLGSSEAETAAATFPTATVDAETHGILLAAAGQPYIDETRKLLNDVSTNFRAQLAAVGPEIANLATLHAGGATFHDPNGAGSPRGIAPPRLPQIRTGGFPASGSSRCGACPRSVSTS